MVIKRILFLLVLALFWLDWMPAAEPRPLPELKRPGMVQVTDSEFAVMDGAAIYLYSLKDMQLTGTFGRQGEGPGELKVTQTWSNRLAVYPGFILAESEEKMVYFSREGKVLKEFRKPRQSGQFTPVGENFAAKKLKLDPDSRLTFVTVVLYDPDLKPIKELYRQPWVQQRNNRGKYVIHLFSDLLNVQVWDDKIFIEESPQGFVIQVFDSKGTPLYRIRKEFDRVPVTAALKKEAEEELKEDPTMKLRIKQFGGWQNVRKMMEFAFPDWLPPIRDMEIADNKIYVKTYKKDGLREEYLVMDLHGKILRRLFISPLARPSLKERMIGVRRSAIKNGKIYYLKENECEEAWYLHVDNID